MKNKIGNSPKRRRAGRLVGATVAAAVLGSCLTAGMAYADEATDAADTLSGVPTCLQSGLFSDQSTGKHKSTLSTKGSLPTALDLRHYNGTVTYDEASGKNIITDGINYVSPVKLQNPFGSCWAFSIIASAETSLLSSLDKADDGEMNGSIDYEKAASGEAGDIAYAASDLSERALAYSIFTYPKSNGMYSYQAGEGAYLTSGVMGDGAQILNTGGMPFSGISTFSCGIGPLPESEAPYISDEGWIEVPIPEFDTSSFSSLLSGTLKKKYFTSLEEATEFWNETWTDETIEDFNSDYGVNITKERVRPARSSKGTWAVDGDKTYGTVAELKESKILEISKGDGLSNEEIASIKEELAEGRGVSIAFCADQSRPGQAISTSNSYINTDNWAQYTYEKKSVNHGVTIVGYDDDYAASNFTHNQYKKDESGKLVIDEEKTAQTTPPGNGAWIVKNSWGSQDADDALDKNNWGNDGYFYLSYYDKNISCMESYEFDTSQEAQEKDSFFTAQYDLSKGSQTECQDRSSVTKTCNVFKIPEQDGLEVSIRDLGCLTGATCDTVTLDVYVMDADADVEETIDKGNPDTTVSEYFDKSGFHRIHLDNPFVLSAGKKVAVVQTTRQINGKYECACIRGLTEEIVSAYNAAHTSAAHPTLSVGSLPSYTSTVVNKGESLLYTDGAWSDWKGARDEYGAGETQEVIKGVRAEADSYQALADAAEDEDMKAFYQELADKLKAFTVDHAYTYDNFSIKIYGDEVTEPVDISSAAVTLSQTSFDYDGTAKTPGVSAVTLSDGTVLSADDYTVEYVDNTDAGAATVTITGTGNFTGSTSACFKITRAELKDSMVSLSSGAYTYDGTAKTPVVTVSGLAEDADYYVTYSSNVNAGTANVTVKGIDNYKGAVTKTFDILKAAQTAENETFGKTFAANKNGKLAKATKISAKLALVWDNAKVTYSLKNVSSKAAKYVTVSSKGIVKVKKGLSKGSYKIVVTATIAGTANYEAKTVKLTYKVKVK